MSAHAFRAYASDAHPPCPQWLHSQLLGSYAGCALQPLELSPAGDPPPLARVLAAAAAATTQGQAGASTGLVNSLAGAGGVPPPGEHAQWMKWQLERYLRAQISHMEIKHAAALKAFCLADADDFALVRRFSPRGLAPADVNVFVQKMTHAAWADGGAARGTAPSSVMEPDDGIGLESCRAVLGLVRYTYSLESVLVALRDAASELQQHVQAGQSKRYAFGIALLDLARDESELNANACDDEGLELGSTLAHVQDDSDDSDDERSDAASAGRSDLDGVPVSAPSARAPSPPPPQQQQQHPRPIGELPKFSALIELNASAEVLALDRLLLEIESHALSTASVRAREAPELSSRDEKKQTQTSLSRYASRSRRAFGRGNVSQPRARAWRERARTMQPSRVSTRRNTSRHARLSGSPSRCRRLPWTARVGHAADMAGRSGWIEARGAQVASRARRSTHAGLLQQRHREASRRRRTRATTHQARTIRDRTRIRFGGCRQPHRRACRFTAHVRMRLRASTAQTVRRSGRCRSPR